MTEEEAKQVQDVVKSTPAYQDSAAPIELLGCVREALPQASRTPNTHKILVI